MVGLHRRLRRLLRRVGLGRRTASRRAPKPRAAAVVVDGDQVLVMKRHKRGRDYALLPGGGVEAGETAAEAALRELHEETTLVGEIDRLLWTGQHNNRPACYFLMTRGWARRGVRVGGAGEPAGQQLRSALGHRRPVHRARSAPA
jgi:ADP-ribose pyrophosphatase YjhB (NUDIX family)